VSRQDRVQEALRQMDDGSGQPCIGCENSAACAALELACRAFQRWVQGTRPDRAVREPTRQMYLKVMRAEDPVLRALDR